MIRLTAGGTSATVAKKSQARPFQNMYAISDTSDGECASPTCLQRSFPKPNRVPSLRRRSKPTSIVRSKTTSETSMAIMLSLLLSVSNTTQALSSGTHSELSG